MLLHSQAEARLALDQGLVARRRGVQLGHRTQRSGGHGRDGRGKAKPTPDRNPLDPTALPVAEDPLATGTGTAAMPQHDRDGPRR